MAQLYVLFEHAAGYALFRSTEFEEITMLLPQVEEKILDLASFRTIVHLVSFLPFRSAKDALSGINSISEGILPPELQDFLETNVPRSKKKKQPVVLGVADTKIGAAISEALSITCQTSGVVPEVQRAIRLHFPHLIDGLDSEAASKAQLGLGHSYSRAKVKFNVNREDNMIIQSINLLDQLDKDINTFAMRMREWYSYHFPELIKIVPENHLYPQVVALIKDRKDMPEDIEEKLEEVLQDSTKVKNIIDVARSSMGMEISQPDLENITQFSKRVVSLANLRASTMEYLKSRIHNVAPSLAILIGETVGARLISHAGSLTNLAKLPASTVQILGAEKALFRALKTRGNTPKYGLIFHSTFIGRAAKQNKGRISRYLANKCSMASRIDCFSEMPTEVFGQRLRKQVEDRLKFYETGEIPPKNLDVMTEATDEAAALQEVLLKKKKKKAKKEKKRQEQESLADASTSLNLDNSALDSSELQVGENGLAENDSSVVSPKKKKRKLKQAAVEMNSSNLDGTLDEETEDPLPKKKKKKKNTDDDVGAIAENDASAFENSFELNSSSKKKKKRKRQSMEAAADDYACAPESPTVFENTELEVSESGQKKKKKKKRKHVDDSE